MKKVVITIIGPDRPGIIASVSETLFQLECNIENISQTLLQSAFAGIYVVSVPESMDSDELQQAIHSNLSDQHLLVVVMPHHAETRDFNKSPVESFIVTTSGPDQKGLVSKISRVIADHNANITNLAAVFKGGDDPDRNIMVYEIDVPVTTDIGRLSENLKNKASENGLELTLQHKNIFDVVNRI
ncbi:MAG: amino acid-binding protein [Proteobacteria bacterium]|nr:amino acid-binding protein [Pseudomonadota bacterium]